MASTNEGDPVDIPIDARYFYYFDTPDIRCRHTYSTNAPICSTIPTTATIYDPDHPWAVRIRCMKCSTSWYWCRVCDKGLLPKDEHMIKPYQINAHGKFPYHLNRMADSNLFACSTETIDPPESNCNLTAASEPFLDNDESMADEPLFDQSFDMDDTFRSSSTDDNETQAIMDDLPPEPQCPTETNERTVSPDLKTRIQTQNPVDGISFEKLFPYENDSSGIQFFEREHHTSGKGICAVVSNAIYDGPNNDVHELTALFGIMFSQFLHKIPRSQHKILSALFDFVTNPPAIITNQRSFSLPTQEGGFARAFVDGSKSIPRNLPRIPIYEFGEYAVMKPTDCFRDAMAYGLVEPFGTESTSILASTPRGKEILDHVKKTSNDDPLSFVASLIPWEDDMDPSHVKGNRHKVFVQQLTIGVPDSRIHTSDNTYPIVLGSANGSAEDKAAVSKFILQDLVELADGIDCYHGGWKRRIEKCRGIIYSILADRPAKAGALWVLAGNSPYHPCFGTVGDVAHVYMLIPSCDCCLSRRINNLPPLSTCPHCQNWVLVGYYYPKPNDYPTNIAGGPSQQFLPFKNIDFESLRNAAMTIFTNILSGAWTTKKATKCYGKTEGLQEDLSDLIYIAAKAATEQDDANKILEDILSPYWRYPFVNIRDWIPGLMHQLFLGIVKAVLGLFVKDWITSQNKHSQFVVHVNKLLHQLKKFNLSWLKVELLSKDGKFGKYVSENYLSYAKVAKWLYSMLSPIPGTDLPYADPPEKLLSQYLVDELRKWLDSRRIEYPSGANKPALYKACVDAVDANDGVWPPIIPPDRLDANLAEVEHLICAMTSMISRIMVQGGIVPDSHIEDTDRHIKYFLSKTDSLLKKYVHIAGNSSKAGKNIKIVEWVDKYNFITLLSIPESLRRYGSHRPLWEGDGKGEASLPLIKVSCKSLKGRWAYRTADRYTERRTMNRCMSSLLQRIDRLGIEDIRMVKLAKELMGLVASEKKCADEEEEEEEDNDDEEDDDDDEEKLLTRELQSYRRSFYRYQNAGSVADCFTVGDVPISVVILTNNRYGVVHKTPKGRPDEVIPLCLDTTVTQCHSGSHYFRWSVTDEMDMEVGEEFGTVDIVDAGLLLPCLMEKGASLYMLVTSDWHEMGRGGKIIRPEVPDLVYE
jgi:hypothetical protein